MSSLGNWLAAFPKSVDSHDHLLKCKLVILTCTLLKRTVVVTMISTMLGDELVMESTKSLEVSWVLARKTNRHTLESATL